MKYTKGPWKSAKGKLYTYDIWSDESHGSVKIAECYGLDRQDNAHLMSAAPELYEAAKALTDCFNISVVPLSDEEISLLNNLKNAIAKAEGK